MTTEPLTGTGAPYHDGFAAGIWIDPVLAQLAYERWGAGLQLEVTVRPAHVDASHAHHGYYRAVLLPLIHDGLRAIGHDLRRETDTHTLLKTMFLVRHDTDELTLEGISRADFTTFCERCTRFAAEFLNLTPPTYDNDNQNCPRSP